MQMEISTSELKTLIVKQLDNFFYFRHKDEFDILSSGVDTALERCKHCFSYTKNKYYAREGKTFFNPLHSGQYSIFLYFLSNAIFSQFPEAISLADRIYYLNKTLNAVDMFYEVQMPPVFFLDHPIGSVLGRAIYGNFFSFSQNCTVGNNKGIYPIIGQNVSMMAGAMLLGDCTIGDNVILSANSYVKDTDIPSCSIVFGTDTNLVIKTRDEAYFHRD